MKLVRMKPGHGDVLLAEGDPEVAEDEERLIEEFRRQLDLGMWAAVPTADGAAARGDHGARLRRDPRGHRAGRVLPAGRRRLTLVLATSLIVLGALAVVGFGPALAERWRRRRPAEPRTRRRRLRPGSRAPRRARARASSCARSSRRRSTRCTRSSASSRSAGGNGEQGYGYLLYPHRPIVAYDTAIRRAPERVLRRLPRSLRAVARPAAARRRRRARQVDVAAGGERELISVANMHVPGRQLDPARCAAT